MKKAKPTKSRRHVTPAIRQAVIASEFRVYPVPLFDWPWPNAPPDHTGIGSSYVTLTCGHMKIYPGSDCAIKHAWCKICAGQRSLPP